jgi:hypothetical protein
MTRIEQKRTGWLEPMREKSVNFPKVRFWCGFTTPLETILAKILEKI